MSNYFYKISKSKMTMLEDLPAMTKAEEDILRLLQFFRNDREPRLLRFARNDNTRGGHKLVTKGRSLRSDGKSVGWNPF